MKKRGRPPEAYLIDISIKGNNMRLYFGGAVQTEDDVIYSESVECYIDTIVPGMWEIIDRTDNPGALYLFKCTDRNLRRGGVYFYIGDRKDEVIDGLYKLEATMRITHK
jgi:hypothetical protein